MKFETSLHNHEIWHECSCGATYDLRRYKICCPECGAPNPDNQKAFAFSVIFSTNAILLLLIIAAVLLSMSSCMTQQYGLRRHRNKVAQEVIQYEHSLSAGRDWTRVWRHWDERPKSRWPFRD